MSGLKLSSIILSIGLGAALLTPLSASAQGPEQQLVKEKLRYETNVSGAKAFTSKNKLSTNNVVEPIVVEDYQYSEKSVRFMWFYNNQIAQDISYRILLNGNEVETVKNNTEGYNEYFIKNSLLPSTDYKITIQVLKNDQVTGEETSISFTTYASPGKEVVTLKDSNLEKAIKEQLLIDDRSIYESDFEHLTYLDAFNSGIKSLDGLERAVNLEELALENNSISDFSPLTQLNKLIYLDLSGNPLTNIEKLLDIPSLKYVGLYGVPLNFSEGTSARKVVDQLQQNDVFVVYNLLTTTKEVVSDKAFGLAWTSYSDEKPDYYEFSYSKQNDITAVEGKTTGNSMFLTGLTPDTDYELYITAYKDDRIVDSLPVFFHTSQSASMNGWVQLGNDWYFYNKDKEKLEKGWLKSGTKWYFMGDNGVMATGWVKTDGKWYFMNESGAMVTGWVNSGGKWYFMNESGAMATGWVKTGGKWYFMNESGAMSTGWVKTGGKWYYMNTSGAMVTGWVQSGGKWYFMNESGAMATGWVKTGGSWYYLDQSGAMMTGWVQSGSKWYYLKADGKMAYSTMIGKYKLGSDGAWIK